jgi:hypothetical protein
MKRSLPPFILLLSLIFHQACRNNPTSKAGLSDTTAYLNPELSVDQRVNDLISRMTPDEKIGKRVPLYGKYTISAGGGQPESSQPANSTPCVIPATRPATSNTITIIATIPNKAS